MSTARLARRPPVRPRLQCESPPSLLTECSFLAIPHSKQDFSPTERCLISLRSISTSMSRAGLAPRPPARLRLECKSPPNPQRTSLLSSLRDTMAICMHQRSFFLCDLIGFSRIRAVNGSTGRARLRAQSKSAPSPPDNVAFLATSDTQQPATYSDNWYVPMVLLFAIHRHQQAINGSTGVGASLRARLSLQSE